ncbi:BTAD domain-containing putative transcriptional regulator [Streptomyces xiamenensis]|uniref:BTAD domain-containing putative transcriptional regulator n=1 Tax=Streptomyces xiamenensis TaxID=408015 RepID=UPI003687341D
MRVEFEVLGPVTARDADSGRPIALKGPRHRAVLARLLVARRRVVPVPRLVADLWDEPPAGAVPALRTFVAALRRALEPDRPPRTPARLLITEGPGYALRADPATVDAERFSSAVAAATPDALAQALALWRGPAYADVADAPWARTERSRLGELRLQAVERRAALLLDRGRAAEAVPDLDAHAAEHPWREDGWRLLALALYRTGRQGEALAVLRRARALLVEQLGVDPGPALRRLEADILAQAGHLEGTAGRVEQVWERTAAAYDRAVGGGSRVRLESTVGLLRELAVTGGGGLEAARDQRTAAVAAAEELGDPELTARVIGAYDVPAIWTRVDDPEHAARVVASAERTLAALPPDAHPAARARLLATVAVESRGTRSARGPRAAGEAVRLARELGDAPLLAFALNGLFMQSCRGSGLAGRREEIGAELVTLGERHALPSYGILGRLIRLQARCARADFAGADAQAAAAERLAERYDRPLVGVFTQWYGALKLAETGTVPQAEAAYRAAADGLPDAGMPGLAAGLLPLALLGLRMRHGLSPEPEPEPEEGPETAAPGAAYRAADWGPYAPWTRPLLLLARNRRAEAATALRTLPPPPYDLLYEAMWCLTARAAVLLGDRETLARARAELAPAAGELAGAGSGLLTLGPVADYL